LYFCSFLSLLIDIFEKLCKKPGRLAAWRWVKICIVFEEIVKFPDHFNASIKESWNILEIVGKNHLEYPGKKSLLGCTNPVSLFFSSSDKYYAIIMYLLSPVVLWCFCAFVMLLC
jgi:hypothetical protein